MHIYAFSCINIRVIFRLKRNAGRQDNFYAKYDAFSGCPNRLLQHLMPIVVASAQPNLCSKPEIALSHVFLQLLSLCFREVSVSLSHHFAFLMIRKTRHRLLQACLLVLISLCCAPSYSTARTWTPDEIPIPRLQDTRHYVSDPEGILSAAATDTLDLILGRLERDRGIQTLVVVVDKLQGNDPYRFAMTLGKMYGVGDRRTRTGLIILLATGDRAYQFLTGRGLEGTLPDGTIQLIEDRIFIPLLKQGQIDQALLTAVRAIDRICREDSTLPQAPRKAEQSPRDGRTLFLLLIAVLTGAFLYYRHLFRRPARCPQCGQRTLHKEQQHITVPEGRYGRRSVLQTVWTCRHCGDQRTDHDDDTGGSRWGDFLTGFLLSSLLRGGGSSRGWGGSTGGSYGGGSFGGGGSGGRY